MKITSVDVKLYRVAFETKRVDAVQVFEQLELVVVEVVTDSGATGTGFTYTIGKGGLALATFIRDDLAPLALGEDPLNTERVWQKCYWGTHWIGRGGLVPLGISALDIALWDLKARHAGMSLHQLLGGSRDRMPVYSTDGGWLHLSEGELVEQSVAFLEQGFRAIKMKVGKPDAAEDVRRVRAVRKAIGDSARLMVDANMGWTPHQAIDMARRLEEFNLGWLEEPCENDDVSGHARLARSTSIPIALGESLYNRFVFKEYIEAGAVSIVQADVCRVGGVTEWLKVAHMAESFNLSVSPHFVMELHLSLVASVSNGLYVEYIPVMQRLMKEKLVLKDGHFEVPKTPGIGVAFDKDTLKRHLVE